MGIFEIKIAGKDIKIDKYEVTVQAQDMAKDKGSAINKVFDLQVLKAPVSQNLNTKIGPFHFSKMTLLNIGGGILILLFVGVLIFIHLRKSKLSKKTIGAIHASTQAPIPEKK